MTPMCRAASRPLTRNFGGRLPAKVWPPAKVTRHGQRMANRGWSSKSAPALGSRLLYRDNRSNQPLISLYRVSLFLFFSYVPSSQSIGMVVSPPYRGTHLVGLVGHNGGRALLPLVLGIFCVHPQLDTARVNPVISVPVPGLTRGSPGCSNQSVQACLGGSQGKRKPRRTRCSGASKPQRGF